MRLLLCIIVYEIDSTSLMDFVGCDWQLRLLDIWSLHLYATIQDVILRHACFLPVSSLFVISRLFNITCHHHCILGICNLTVHISFD